MYPEIYIIEDDADDAFLLQQAFNDVGCKNLLLFSTTEHAMKHLLTLDNDALPCMIVTDFNLPMQNVFNLLAFLDYYPPYQVINTAIVSGGFLEMHKERLNSAGAFNIFKKPNSYDGYLELAEELATYVKPCLTIMESDAALN